MSNDSGQQATGQNTPNSGDTAANNDEVNRPQGEAEQTGDRDAATTLYGEDPKPEGDDPKDTGDADKADDGAQEGEEGEDGEGEDGPPEDGYQFDIPEGLEPDDELAQEFADVAHDMGLSQAEVDRLVPLAAQMQQKQMQQQQDTIAQWAEQVKQDKELGGEKLEENLATARTSIETFGDDDLKQILNQTGLGNHPAMIRFANRVGKAISEDRLVRGTPPSATKGSDDPAKKMFPNMN